MGDKAHARTGAAGGTPAAGHHPRALRNVALVGHSGSGKTTLVEALAQTAGALGRAGRVEDGTTVSDHAEIEHRQNRSVQLSLVPVDWDGHRINLLDTPGYADFVGEVRAGLRAADAALFVVSAAQEPEAVAATTRALWEECAAVAMPRALVVTHLDTARTPFDAMTRICGELFGGDDPDAVLPLYLPVLGPEAADGHAPLTGLTGLLTERVFDYSSGERAEHPPSGDERAPLAEARARLIEGIIAESEDETLMDRYLGGEAIDTGTLITDLERAVARGSFHPVLAAAPAAEGARQGIGTVELLDLITGGFPTPLGRVRKVPSGLRRLARTLAAPAEIPSTSSTRDRGRHAESTHQTPQATPSGRTTGLSGHAPEHPLPAVTAPDGSPLPALDGDPEGPLVAEVVKTSSDPYVGWLSLVRVFSGTLRPDDTVHVHGHGLDSPAHEDRPDHEARTRVGALTSPFGKQQRPLDACVAGDLACVARLETAETGDTLSGADHPLLLAPWTTPDPLLPLAVQAHSKADEDKLSHSLARLVAEDPAMRLEQNPDTGQLVLWCLGEAHLDVALDRLRDHYGVQVDTVPHRVALRETFAGPATGHGRHVKQSGGHGQYAVCEIDVEPLPAGSGVEFVDRVVGGSVPRPFIASVEKGVRAQAARGVAAGHPLVDIRVVLRDGKAHSVDSSDAAFQTAGALALREAAAEAHVRFLEPVAEVSVLVPDDYVGPVMSDLSGRRGRVTGTEQSGSGRTLVRADVPELEIGRYAVDLRALTHGTGRFDRAYARHEPMPPQLADRVHAPQG